MSSECKQNLPQEGTCSTGAGESLPGATSAPGCPSYSGGGTTGISLSGSTPAQLGSATSSDFTFAWQTVTSTFVAKSKRSMRNRNAKKPPAQENRDNAQSPSAMAVAGDTQPGRQLATDCRYNTQSQSAMAVAGDIQPGRQLATDCKYNPQSQSAIAVAGDTQPGRQLATDCRHNNAQSQSAMAVAGDTQPGRQLATDCRYNTQSQSAMAVAGDMQPGRQLATDCKYNPQSQSAIAVAGDTQPGWQLATEGRYNAQTQSAMILPQASRQLATKQKKKKPRGCRGGQLRKSQLVQNNLQNVTEGADVKCATTATVGTPYGQPEPSFNQCANTTNATPQVSPSVMQAECASSTEVLSHDRLQAKAKTLTRKQLKAEKRISADSLSLTARKRRRMVQGEDKPLSYGKPAQSHLHVAVTTIPSKDFTDEQAEEFKTALEAATLDTILASSTAGAEPLIFQGKPHLSDGVLKIWCGNEAALAWLQETVATMPSPIQNTTLTIISQSDITRTVKAGMLLPTTVTTDMDKIFRVLIHQNPQYNVRRWKLIRAEVQEGKGIFLILGIPEQEVPRIQEGGRRIAYVMGSVYIKFFTPHGFSGSSNFPPNDAITKDEGNKHDETTDETVPDAVERAPEVTLDEPS